MKSNSFPQKLFTPLFLLAVIFAGTFFLTQPEIAQAQTTWTVEELESYVVASTTAGYATQIIYFPSELDPNAYSATFVLKQLPTNNNYYAITNGIHCYPRLGGSGGFPTSSTTRTLDASQHHTSNTSGGSPACNVSGTYYNVWRDTTASTTILYVASYYYDAGANTYTNADTQCTSCTRFVTHDPSAGENVASSTFTIINETVYVSSDDYWEGHTNIRYTYTNFSNNELTETFDEPLLNSGYSTTTFIATEISENGTYSVVAEIYTDSWYTSRETLRLENFNFYSGATSTIEEMIGETKDYLYDVYGGITCSLSFTSFGTEAFDCLLDYIWASVVPPPDVLATRVNEQVSQITSLPPFGYAKRISEIFSATSTGSSSIGFIVSFPSTSPMSGKTLNLNTGEQLVTSLSQISNMEVDTINGSPYDMFLYYWELLWWIIFALWVVREIYQFQSHNINHREELKH